VACAIENKGASEGTHFLVADNKQLFAVKAGDEAVTCGEGESL
jgi:hypothetical protein